MYLQQLNGDSSRVEYFRHGRVFILIREETSCATPRAKNFSRGFNRATSARSPTSPVRYSSKIYQLAFSYSAEQGRRRRNHPGRAVQGVPKRRRVPRRRGAVVLDLPDHLQRGDVAPAHGALSAVRRTRTGLQRLTDREESGQPGTRRRGRLVGHGRRAGASLAGPASSCSAPSLRCRRSIARRSCCATSRECRPEEASAMLRVKDQTLKSRLHRGPFDPAQAARRISPAASRSIGRCAERSGGR